MSALSLMTQTCTITPRTPSVSSSGARTYANGTALTNVPCNIQRMSASDAIKYGLEQATEMYMCYLPATFEGSVLSVKHYDRVTVGSTVYRVVGPSGKRVPQAQHQELSLELDTP